MEGTSAVWRLGIRVPICGVSALASAVANVICSCTEALGLGCHHFPALQGHSIDSRPAVVSLAERNSSQKLRCRYSANVNIQEFPTEVRVKLCTNPEI